MSSATPDEFRIEVERALTAIPSLLSDALAGTNPDRSACRDVARALCELHAESILVLGQAEADAMVLPALEDAQARIVAVFGSGGWEEPEGSPRASTLA